ncbi:MAG: lysozyme [Mucilaginibacter sp.]
MAFKTSAAQIERIKNYESFSAKAYQDGKSGDTVLHSIGYGHQIGASESYLLTATVTKTQATVMLAADVSPLEIQINRDCVQKLTQNGFDSFIDFGYNVGSGALSKIIATYNVSALNTDAVFAQMRLYNKWHDKSGNLVVNNDLTKRREAEISNFGSIFPAISPTFKKGALIAGVAVAALVWLGGSNS